MSSLDDPTTPHPAPTLFHPKRGGGGVFPSVLAHDTALGSVHSSGSGTPDRPPVVVGPQPPTPPLVQVERKPQSNNPVAVEEFGQPLRVVAPPVSPRLAAGRELYPGFQLRGQPSSRSVIGGPQRVGTLDEPGCGRHSEYRSIASGTGRRDLAEVVARGRGTNDFP